jgi:hypothetical protein
LIFVLLPLPLPAALLDPQLERKGARLDAAHGRRAHAAEILADAATNGAAVFVAAAGTLLLYRRACWNPWLRMLKKKFFQFFAPKKRGGKRNRIIDKKGERPFSFFRKK